MVFTEEQKMRNPILWVLLIGLLGLSVVAIYYRVMLHRDFGNHHTPLAVSIFVFCLILLLISFFATVKVTSTIDRTGISYTSIPIGIKDSIAWNDIMKIAYVNYWNTWRTAFGNQAFTKGAVMPDFFKPYYCIQVETKQRNKNFMIGTRKLKEMQETITSLAPKDVIIDNKITY